MKENNVAGTKGYSGAVQKFTEATLAIDFAEICTGISCLLYLINQAEY